MLLYSSWIIVANSPATILEAIEIQEQYQLSFWDALIIAAASASGSNILYTEDLAVLFEWSIHWDEASGTVRVKRLSALRRTF